MCDLGTGYSGMEVIRSDAYFPSTLLTPAYNMYNTRPDWEGHDRSATERMTRRRILTLNENDIDRLTAAVVIPRLAEVYLGLLQNSIACCHAIVLTEKVWRQTQPQSKLS
jgi:hypothetical protein